MQDGKQSNPSAMQIIPAIDLLGGSCVRLHQGDYDQVTRFSDDPVAQASELAGPGCAATSPGGPGRSPQRRTGQ